MKKHTALEKAGICLLNCLPIAIVSLLYRGGAPADIMVFTLAHFILLWFNYAHSENPGILLLFNGFLLISTFLGYYTSGYLYLKNICDDIEGRMVIALITLIGCTLVLVVSIIQAIVKYCACKKQQTGNE